MGLFGKTFMALFDRKNILLLGMVFSVVTAFGQNIGINASGAAPDGSAMLDVSATDKGILIPRTDTATLNASGITLATGLMIYQNADNKFYYYNGSIWIRIDGPNTDNQTVDQLSLSGSTLNLSLSNDGVSPSTLDLSPINTDEQQVDNFSLSGTTLSLSLQNDGVAPSTVSLASLADDLGNHTATQNVELNGNWLSNDGGNEGIAITNAGLVGIGTDSPGEDLTVVGFSRAAFTSTQSNYIQMGHGGSNAFIDWVGSGNLDFRTNNSNLMILTSSGNLAIGNFTPSSKLDVAGDIEFSGTLKPDNLAGTSGQVLISGGSSNSPTWVDATSLTVTGDNLGNHTATANVQLGSNWLSSDGDSEGIRIGSDGHVGIGSNSITGSLLYMKGTGGSMHNLTSSSTDESAFTEWNNSTGVRGIIGANGSGFAGTSVDNLFSIATWSNHGMNFYTNQNERMRLTNAGRLGIGETNPQTSLDVVDAAVIGNISVGSQSTTQDGSSVHSGDGFLTTPWLYSNAIEAAGERGSASTLITIGADGTYGGADQIHLVTSGSSRFSVNSSGGIGIGATNTGSALLEVNTTIRAGGTVTASDFNYSSTQTRYHNIPTGAWQECNPAGGNNLSSPWEVGLQGSVSGFPCMIAPVYFPDGALLTGISAYVTDNSSSNLDVRIYRSDWNGGGSTIIFNTISTSGTPGTTTLSTTSLFNSGAATIDNQNYMYFALIQFNGSSNGSSLYLRGCRISYTVTSPD